MCATLKAALWELRAAVVYNKFSNPIISISLLNHAAFAHDHLIMIR